MENDRTTAWYLGVLAALSATGVAATGFLWLFWVAIGPAGIAAYLVGRLLTTGEANLRELEDGRDEAVVALQVEIEIEQLASAPTQHAIGPQSAPSAPGLDRPQQDE